MSKEEQEKREKQKQEELRRELQKVKLRRLVGSGSWSVYMYSMRIGQVTPDTCNCASAKPFPSENSQNCSNLESYSIYTYVHVHVHVYVIVAPQCPVEVWSG